MKWSNRPECIRQGRGCQGNLLDFKIFYQYWQGKVGMTTILGIVMIVFLLH